MNSFGTDGAYQESDRKTKLVLTTQFQNKLV